MKRIYSAVFFIFFFVSLHAQSIIDPLIPDHEHWADSVLSTLSLDDKIGQLFMVAAYSNRDTTHENDIVRLIRGSHIGGLIFFQGGPVRQSLLINHYQAVSKIPLWIGEDSEWGLGMRLDSTISFPFQMALGAIDDNHLIYKMGAEIAREFHRLGMNINFAPDADVNNNPNNPVINFRSFGEVPQKVAVKALEYMKGLQDNHILASAKHFPGHGDTNTDSHSDLPVIKNSYQHLDSVELVPFRCLICHGVGSIMVAHLDIPALDPTPHLPSTLSKPVITGLLRDSLNFRGIVFTDAMNMQGVAKYYQPGEAELMALEAGNDVILFPRDVPKSIAMIKNAVKTGQISEKDIDARVRKILIAKSWTGARAFKPIDTLGLISDLNNSAAMVLDRKLTEKSLTLIKNDSGILPLQHLDTLHLASVSIGQKDPDILQERLSSYTTFHHFFIQPGEDIKAVIDSLKNYNLVLLNVKGLSRYASQDYGINDEMIRDIQALITQCPVILTWFGNPYGLMKIPGFTGARAVIVTYQDTPFTSDLAPQLVFGAIGASGKLPVTINAQFPEGTGIQTAGGLRLRYGLPEEVDLNGAKMVRGIDSIAAFAAVNRVAPGFQVLVARNGEVVFHKTYGYHTYDSLVRVSKNDLYDFASVTKVSASTPALMKMYDENKIHLEGKLGDYFPYFSHGNKKNLTLRRMLAHDSGLTPYINFWQTTIRKNGKYRHHTLALDSSSRYPIRITPHLFEYKDYKNKIYKMIRKSPVHPDQGYVYSDLSFYLYPAIVERLTGIPWETFLKQTFYKPLGANTLTYNPTRFFSLKQIIPTENDTFFRHEQVHGTVHDEGAAMMNGVSGHAGLFGTENDLAKLVQMYLNWGEYGGQRFIAKSTLKLFETCQYCNEGVRRGLGFDRPMPGHPVDGTCAMEASDSSFGHSGYTGTYWWADPETGILFIFFSNRVYPTRNNNKLSQLNIRPAMDEVVYESRMDK